MGEVQKLKGKEKFAYGIGAVGKDMVYMLSASYVLYYYQDIMGVSAVAVSYTHLQSCYTVVDACNVFLSAATFKNLCCDSCEVITCQFYIFFCFQIVIIFSTRCLQIKFLDREEEYEIEN